MVDTFDIEKVKRNCEHFSKQSRAVDVLKNANGKSGYKAIATTLNIHHTAVSRYLKEAERLGLVIKKGKFYKKVPGIIKFCKNIKCKNVKKKIVDSERIALQISKTQQSIKSKAYIGVSGNIGVDRMAKAYAWLFITENTLRDLIRRVFKPVNNWWGNNVNQKIQDEVKLAIDNYPYDGASRKDELEYTHLSWLKEIIVAKKNWPLFVPHLKEKDKNSFSVIVDKAIASRNSIAHCTPLTNEDYRFIEVRFKDILKMII